MLASFQAFSSSTSTRRMRDSKSGRKARDNHPSQDISVGLWACQGLLANRPQPVSIRGDRLSQVMWRIAEIQNLPGTPPRFFPVIASHHKTIQQKSRYGLLRNSCLNDWNR